MTLKCADFHLKACTFPELSGWETDEQEALIPALAKCIEHIRQVKPYKAGCLGLSSEDLLTVADSLAETTLTGGIEARHFFEKNFVPFKIEMINGRRGFVTAFYEPVVEVQDFPDSNFQYPFYSAPLDLVEIDVTSPPENWNPEYRFGRRVGGSLSLYPDREAIDRGLLLGHGLEIAWAKSRVDVFFAHVQGAAQLLFQDGRKRRITYSAKNGHPFSGIGRYLVDTGEILEDRISMQAIRSWLRLNPERVDEVLWKNRSYIFFRETTVEDPDLGPIAAAKVQLVAGRSLAVDRTIHTFGFPFFVRAETITHMGDDGKPFARLMLATDTGSAIIGPARGDIFTGSGEQAGELAGAVRSAADFYILIPRQVASRYMS